MEDEDVDVDDGDEEEEGEDLDVVEEDYSGDVAHHTGGTFSASRSSGLQQQLVGRGMAELVEREPDDIFDADEVCSRRCCCRLAAHPESVCLLLLFSFPQR